MANPDINQLATAAGRKDELHVLILPSWYPTACSDNAGSFFREQAISLAAAGVRVGVAAVCMVSPRSLNVLRKLRGMRWETDCAVKTLRFHGVNWWSRMPKEFARRWLRHGRDCVDKYIEMHGRPDILHAHSLLYGGVLAKEVSRDLDIPFVVTEHNSYYARGKYALWQMDLAADAARHACIRFAVSSSLAETMKDCLGQSHDWRILPNMVNSLFFKTPFSLTSHKKNTFVFLTVAGLVQHKNIDLLLNAFHNAHPRVNGMLLNIVGEGPDRSRLEAMARDLGITENVNFLGKLDRHRVPAEMATADAYVLSSQYETFGVALIEALAMGLPAVATRCGGPETILSVRQGILVTSGNVAELASGMLRLRYGQKNFDRNGIRHECRARFSEEVVVSLLLNDYKTVLCTNA